MTTQIITVSVDDDINMALPDRRLGLLQFSTDLLTDPAVEDVLLTIFSELIPLDCKHDFATLTTRYICLSSHFDPVPVGDLIPEYTVTVTSDPQGLKSVVFLKKGSTPSTPPSAAKMWPYPNQTTNPPSTGASSSPSQNDSSSLTPTADDTISISVDLDLDLSDQPVVTTEPKKFDTIKDMFK